MSKNDNVIPIGRAKQGIFRKNVAAKPHPFTFKGVIDSIINDPDARLNVLVTGNPTQKPTYEQMRDYILAKDKSLDVLKDVEIFTPTMVDTSPWVSTVKSHLRDDIDPSHIVHNTMPPRSDMRLPYPIIRFTDAEQKMVDRTVEIFKNLFEPFAMAFREETTVQYLGREEQRRAKTTQKLKQAGYVSKPATGPKKRGDRNAVQFVREVKPHPLLKGIIKKTEN